MKAREIGPVASLTLIAVQGQAQALILPEILSEPGNEFAVIVSSYPLKLRTSHPVVVTRASTIQATVKMWFQLLRILRSARSAKQIVLYAPHLLGFFANAIYYRYRNKVKFVCCFDGILNYRAVSGLDPVIRRYQYKQALKALTIFHRYHFEYGDILGGQNITIEQTIVPSGAIVERLKGGVQVKQVSVHVPKGPPTESVLILEPIFRSTAHRIAFQGKLVEWLKAEHGGRLVLVKPHPSRNGATDLNVRLADEGFSCSVVKDSIPAESYYFEQGCRAVVSTDSSALLLIKAIDPLADVISVTLPYAPMVSEVRDLMAETGIRFV